MKELKFIHITKNGGSSIEAIGLKNGIQWGMHHKEYGWRHRFFPLQPEDFKKRYDWFTVVRNPYSRVVSEFYCPWSSEHINQGTLDVELFNETIIYRIHQRFNSQGGNGDHWCEQYKYIDENVLYILKFENLQKEFNDLMKKYNLSMKLDMHQNKSTKIFSEKNLSTKTIELINDVYDKDFRLFNYKKRNIENN